MPLLFDVAVTVTTTGNIDDLDFSNARLIRMNNASLATIRGLKAGYPGQRVRIVSIGAGQVNLSHQDTGDATAASRLICMVTSGKTPLAAGVGTAECEYDGTTARWRLVDHDQGAWITPTFAAGDWTGNGAMTVTVDAGDVNTDRYLVSGKTVHYQFFLATITVGGTPNNAIYRTIPGSYTVSTAGSKSGSGGPMRAQDNGTYKSGFVFVYNPAGANPSQIWFTLLDLTNWAASANNSGLFGNLEFEVD